MIPKLRYFVREIHCPGHIRCLDHPCLLFSFLFLSAAHLILRLLLICNPSADLMLKVPTFVIPCLFLWLGMFANMSTIWTLDALCLWVNVEWRWLFLGVIRSLESSLLVPGSSSGCNAEVGVCPFRAVLATRRICRSFIAMRRVSTSVRCGIRLDRTLGVRLRKFLFL